MTLLMTLAEKLVQAAGRPAGFDYMRLILALAVVSFHTVDLTYGQKAGGQVWANAFYGSLGMWIVPAFFALSGFLVAGSLEHCKTIAGFLYLRIIRIFPALIVEITLSALVLGPVMTTLPLNNYFHDPLFRHYFLNCIGYIHYFLPGVFAGNPLPSFVNRQLWTVPFESRCYVILAALGVLGIAHHRGLFAAVVFGVFGAIAFHWKLHHGLQRMPLPGRALIICFLFGVLAYSFRQIIPHSIILAFMAAVWLFSLPNGPRLAPLPVAYVVVSLGLSTRAESRSWNPATILTAFISTASRFSRQSSPPDGSPETAGWTWRCPFRLWCCLRSVPGIFEKRCLEMRRFRPSIDHWFSFTRPGNLVGQVYRLAGPAKV
jgi:peptidoglycan/LPS O-acetylase OafA/YrhL